MTGSQRLSFAALPLALALVVAARPAQARPSQGPDHVVAPGALEGRPAAAQTSPLQARIDRASAGSVVDVEPGTYAGDLVIDRPVRLVGHGRPLLLGSGTGSVVRIRADDVTVEGFDIDGRGGGDLGRDPSGVHVAARRATVRDCMIRNTLFGVYLREADGATVASTRIYGIPGKDPGEKGSGIHVWNTNGFRCLGNMLVDVRDGLYIESSPHGVLIGNRAHDLRYGVHYMYSDDNVFEDNVFERGAAGAALMYSRRIAFRRNRFLRNRGFASVGLLLKTVDDIVAEDNFIGDNARGLFLEDSYRNRFTRNVIAASDAAIVLYDSSAGNRFTGNAFVGNLTPLTLVGTRTDADFDGNYWSDNDEPDLDGDGRSDRPYRLSNVFDHLRGNVAAADLFARGIGASALGVAERAFPVLRQVDVVDRAPLAHLPDLSRVPRPEDDASRSGRAGLAASVLMLGCGVVALVRGRGRAWR